MLSWVDWRRGLEAVQQGSALFHQVQPTPAAARPAHCCPSSAAAPAEPQPEPQTLLLAPSFVSIRAPTHHPRPLFCSKYFGATSSKVITPLQAVVDALPSANVVYNASTARFFTTENAKADADACEVGAGCRAEGRAVVIGFGFQPGGGVLLPRDPAARCSRVLGAGGWGARVVCCKSLPIHSCGFDHRGSCQQASDVCILFLGHRMSTKQSQWQREKVRQAGHRSQRCCAASLPA